MNEQLITSTSLREYFHTSVNDAVTHQQIDTQPETILYIVNLLTEFSHSDKLFEHTENGVEFKPLALRLADAVEETCSKTQTRMLQKLGDSALFIAGIFPDSLNNKLVDIDYYIAMGGQAYSSVSEIMRNAPGMATLKHVFNELTEKFAEFVDVLAEVSDQTHLASNIDLMRLYEVWLRTGSKRAGQRLQNLGVVPVKDSRPDYRH